MTNEELDDWLFNAYTNWLDVSKPHNIGYGPYSVKSTSRQLKTRLETLRYGAFTCNLDSLNEEFEEIIEYQKARGIDVEIIINSFTVCDVTSPNSFDILKCLMVRMEMINLTKQRRKRNSLDRY